MQVENCRLLPVRISSAEEFDPPREEMELPGIVDHPTTFSRGVRPLDFPDSSAPDETSRRAIFTLSDPSFLNDLRRAGASTS